MLLLGVVLATASGAVLLVGWLLYPRLVMSAARSNHAANQHSPQRSVSAPSLPVTVVIATRESPDLLVSRVGNLLANGYPPELLTVVVAVDARAEFPIDAYGRALGGIARVVRGDEPGGKACALNAGVRAADTAIVVFADSIPQYRDGTIAALVRELTSAADVGAVTGTLDLNAGTHGNDVVLSRLWEAELALRRAHAALHSVCVVTGCVYAIRRDLWQPLPVGAICDDLFVPMGVIASGFRVGVSDAALAVDTRRFSRAQEFQRKVRTLTGMLQFVRHQPHVLLPWRNPVWSQFVFHKLMRIATPFLVVTGAIGVLIAALSQPLPWVVWALVFGSAAVFAAGALLAPARSRRWLANIGWALVLLCAPLVAVWNALRGRWDVWQPHPSSVSRG
jgi:cellulose synthase/poly-beta-1,6-N-acetylglucosamine synthase-like glycosyltransferase